MRERGGEDEVGSVDGRETAEQLAGATDTESGAPPVLAADGVTKTFGSGDGAVRAVDDVDLEIERGTLVGLLGPNGAGKTTTIKMLLGLILPDEGRIRVDGVDVVDSPRTAYRSVSAMLEGARNVYWRLTVRENLRYFARLGARSADPDRIDALIERVGLSEKADATVNELSRGMKQRVSLACTLIRETPIAFLDEPTLGLDVESSLELRKTLRDLADAESRTILISSHDMDVIEAVCDRVIIMNDGRIVADDAVDDLLEVFRTQTYRVTVAGELSADRRRRLEAHFDAENWVCEGDNQRFDAPRVQGDELHDVLDVVRESDRSLVRVTALEPDLEDVFLRLTDDAGGETDDAGGEDETARGDPDRDRGRDRDGDRDMDMDGDRDRNRIETNDQTGTETRRWDGETERRAADGGDGSAGEDG